MKNMFEGLIAGAIFGAGSVYLWHIKAESLPTFWIACVAGWFAYCAYVHTREKFRLDLFDKRFALFEMTLRFCEFADGVGLAQMADSMRQGARKSEFSKTIMGEPNLTRLLFGDDIVSLASEIKEMIKIEDKLTTLNAFNEPTFARDTNCTKRIKEIYAQLPGMFNKYLKFSEYH